MIKNTEKTHWFFDRLETYDGYIIYWLHTGGATDDIEPEDLFYDEYCFMDKCEEIVLSGDTFTNYCDEIMPDEMIEEWEKEKEIDERDI